MKMSAGIWIGILSGIVGVLIAIVAVINTAGSEGIYTGLTLLVVVGGVFYLIYKVFLKSLLNSSRLQKIGIPGKATILEVSDTGVTINENPQVKLKLEVQPNYGKKYTTETKALVSRINPGAFRAGMEVFVKIDPKNDQNVVIDNTSSAATTAQPNEKAIQEEIMRLQTEGQTIIATGKSARAIIKKYTWLGVNVNGANPYVELELEILPEFAASFSGKAKGVIAESSVPKYQPGKEIFVKYDYYDSSKVVIDHS